VTRVVALPLTYAPVRPLRTRWQRVAVPLGTIGALAGATVALHLRDPHASGSWGLCPSAQLGFWCPGCGGLRAVNDLSNVQIADAASSNLLFVASIPLIVFLLGRWTIDRWRGTTRKSTFVTSTWFVAIVLSLMVVFSVVRNLPIGAWLAP